MAVTTSRAHPTKELVVGGPVAIPTANTSVSTVDSFLSQIWVSNTSGGSLTLTVTNAAGTNIFATPIAAGSTLLENWPDLLLATGGVKWQGSNTGLVGEVFGYIRGA